MNLKYDKQDQQGNGAFDERNPNKSQWQEAKVYYISYTVKHDEKK
jgi:hypothetical protein